jgi:hypothetical protein
MGILIAPGIVAAVAVIFVVSVVALVAIYIVLKMAEYAIIPD